MMSVMRRANWISVGAFAFAAISMASCRSPQMVPELSPQTIRSIKIGMTEKQVIAILGRPLQIRPWGDAASLYDYAIPGWAASSASLWIHLENGTVRTVHARRHRIIGEDHAVYETRDDQPTFESPEFDSTFTRQ